MSKGQREEYPITSSQQAPSMKRGIELPRDPQRNKSTAFTEAEREALGLTGLLPSGVEDEETQVRRALLQQLGGKPTDLERHIYLIGLLDTDEVLFYKVVMSDPARFLPIVYDPTVGEACLKFGHIYRRPRGMYLSVEHKGHMAEVLRNWPVSDVRVICVSSGGRILGLSDLGANGMGIPIGKLQLYTACAAVPPDGLLPIHFDIGTTNQALLNDPLYLGLSQPRVSDTGPRSGVQLWMKETARPTTEPAMPMKASMRRVRDSQPLAAAPIVRRSAAMRLRIQMSGTAAMPLNTAENTRKWMGLTPMRLRHRPISMAPAMTP